MSSLLELLGDVVFPVLEMACWIVGYSPDWASTRDDSKQRSSVLSVFLWLTAFLLLCGTMIWLALR